MSLQELTLPEAVLRVLRRWVHLQPKLVHLPELLQHPGTSHSSLHVLLSHSWLVFRQEYEELRLSAMERIRARKPHAFTPKIVADGNVKMVTAWFWFCSH